MPKEVTGYWHSKDAIHSQQEAEEIVANFSALGLHVDVLVLDGPGYKACDSCTAFEPTRWPDPKSMVSRLKANNTYVMAHVHIEQNFSSPYFVGGQQFIDKQWMVHQRTASGELVPICRNNGTGPDKGSLSCRYDPFIPEARAALWHSVKETLVANGIHMFWLDGNEIVGEDTWEMPEAPLGPAMWLGPGRGRRAGCVQCVAAAAEQQGRQLEGRERQITPEHLRRLDLRLLLQRNHVGDALPRRLRVQQRLWGLVLVAQRDQQNQSLGAEAGVPVVHVRRPMP